MKRIAVLLAFLVLSLSLCAAAEDSPMSASERYKASAKFSSVVQRLFDLSDEHQLFNLSSGEKKTAGEDFTPGWYRLFYVGDQDAFASLSREAVKTENDVYLFGEQAINLRGMDDVPFASFEWHDSDGSRYTFVDFPVPKGTRISFEATGSSEFEQLWMFLVEKL